MGCSEGSSLASAPLTADLRACGAWLRILSAPNHPRARSLDTLLLSIDLSSLAGVHGWIRRVFSHLPSPTGYIGDFVVRQAVCCVSVHCSSDLTPVKRFFRFFDTYSELTGQIKDDNETATTFIPAFGLSFRSVAVDLRSNLSWIHTNPNDRLGLASNVVPLETIRRVSDLGESIPESGCEEKRARHGGGGLGEDSPEKGSNPVALGLNKELPRRLVDRR